MDSKIEQQAFTLTMLGTLTDYFPDLKKTPKITPYIKGNKVKSYPKGETLSLISATIKTRLSTLPGKVDAKNPYSLLAEEITVLNGPKTDGANVGEKIAQGLAAILKAISRAQTQLNIIAHSRGAVEAILIAHELEAIQKIATTCSSFDEVLKQLNEQQTQRRKGKSTNNTPDVIEPLKAQINLIPKEEQEPWFNKLKTALPQAKLNFFGIDPVPGDCFPVTWYDERFFTLPGIIKNTELIYYANEHSDWGFTPIFPDVAIREQQNFVRYSMPGHHGTGSSGNNGSQQGIIVAPDGYKTTHVQKLILYKLLHFLSKQGVEFHENPELFAPHRALGRKYLRNPPEAESIKVGALDFPTILRELYTEIAKNQPGYNAYNSTHYSYMGLINQRKSLLKGHTYGLFNDIFASYSGYVNEEHALLMQSYFFKIFGLDTQQKNPTAMLNIANTVLEEQIKKIANKEPSILDYEVTRQTVLETFGIVIRQVSQQYLTEDWSSAVKQKETLYDAIVHILTTFKELSAAENTSIQQFATELLGVSFTSINQILLTQSQSLEKDVNYLREAMDTRLLHFFNALLMQVNHGEENALPGLNEIINAEEYKRLPEHPPLSKISHIYQNLAGKGLEQYTIEQLSQSYAEQCADTIDDFARLYQQIRTFIHDLTALRSIVPNDKIEINALDLLKLTNELIATAAKRFYKDRPEDLPPVAQTDSFLKLAERYAIEYLGVCDRTKEKKESAQQATNGVISKALSFFWSPVSRIINSSQTTPIVRQESTETPQKLL